ncbi:MAG: KOW domain-containing RNA-binding protein [Clostridia bacterium]|nr:KOW domain-containing RNA-binding protein [Clostridia bacterium]MBQ7504628.1 KOW domain-containing RNA-binding protein [Ruminococcus sp.]
MEKGRIVKSKAGKDKEQFYIVTDIKGDRVYVCDGKLRKFSNPKSKNPKHLAVTSAVVKMPENDRQLRILLKSFGSTTKED